jgi:hypothetical protein
MYCICMHIMCVNVYVAYMYVLLYMYKMGFTSVKYNAITGIFVYIVYVYCICTYIYCVYAYYMVCIYVHTYSVYAYHVYEEGFISVKRHGIIGAHTQTHTRYIYNGWASSQSKDTGIIRRNTQKSLLSTFPTHTHTHTHTHTIYMNEYHLTNIRQARPPSPRATCRRQLGPLPPEPTTRYSKKPFTAR